MTGDSEGLLTEQADFYRADAAGYESWLRQLGQEANDSPLAVGFRAGRDRVAALLGERAPLGRVLEVAAGTGILSELVAPHAEHLELVDSSPESLELARQRLARHGGRVSYRVVDVLEDDLSGPYDLICFSSWLHHVPRDHFDDFWVKVGSLLKPGGWVLFDFPGADHSVAELGPPPPEPSQDYRIYRMSGDVSIRDHAGQRWRVVHVLWDPMELRRRLQGLGWTFGVETAGWFSGFWWAAARRSADSGPESQTVTWRGREEAMATDFLTAAQEAAVLLEDPGLTTRWDEPSVLAGYTVGELAGHFARAVGVTNAVLARGASSEPARDDVVASYSESIASWETRSADIRANARGEADAGPTAMAARYRAALEECRSLLGPKRPSPVRNGRGEVLELADYLLIRAVELLVHADDLAASLNASTPPAPTALSRAVNDLLMGAARYRHGETAVLRALARRERDGVQALRVI